MLRKATAPANVFKINEVAEDIEKEMARIAPQCSTAVELRDKLAEQIANPEERTAFLRQAGGEPKRADATAEPRTND